MVIVFSYTAAIFKAELCMSTSQTLQKSNKDVQGSRCTSSNSIAYSKGISCIHVFQKLVKEELYDVLKVTRYLRFWSC